MPIYQNFVAAVGDILITAEGISEICSQMFLNRLDSVITIRNFFCNMYPWSVLLELRFVIGFIHFGISFDVRKMIQLECVSCIEGVIVHCCNGRGCIVLVSEFYEHEPPREPQHTKRTTE